MRILTVLWRKSTVHLFPASVGQFLLLGALVLCTPGLAVAGTLSGNVKNGTTSRMVSGAQVSLMELQHGMVVVGKSKTDPHGLFRFSDPRLGKNAMLLEVSYQGVSYYQSVSPSDRSASVVVFSATSNSKAILVGSHAIMFQPQGSTLDVEEQYVVQNQTNPPLSFYVANGSFQFQIPDGAELGQVSTWTADNLPTLQRTIDLPNHRKAIDWAFRPGKNIVRISYTLPYASNQATIHAQSPYPASHVFVAAPPGVQVSSDGFSLVGTEEGYDVYGHPPVTAEAPIVVSLSGAASTPAGQANHSAASEDSGSPVTTLPTRLFSMRWIFFCGIALVAVLVAIFLWRKSTVEGNAPAPKGSADRNNQEKSRFQRESSRPPVQIHIYGPAEQQSLDDIKEKLFRLELRRQAGTISDADYALEHEEMEKHLRKFAKVEQLKGPFAG